MKNVFLILFILIICFIVYMFLRKNFKNLKVPSVCLVTGGVKTGKSLLCVRLSIKDYKKRHRKWWFATHILLKKNIEEPLYYTNCSITFGNNKTHRKHKLDKNIVALTKEHLMRDIRFNYKSVIYVNECSLLADNMDYNDKQRNVELSLFNKLLAHMTRGGIIYYDTQSILDSHYSIKRVCSSYIYILRDLNLLLFHVLYVREMINTENGVNNFEDDVEMTMRKVFVPFWYHYKYDRYEYSYLTDDLSKNNTKVPYHQGVVSFNPLYMDLADKRKDEDKK